MYEDRVFFKRGNRDFLDRVISAIGLVSLRGLLPFVFVPYSSLKNYYSERRLMPTSLFSDLIYLGKIDKGKIDFKILKGNWGQVNGGKKGRGVSKKKGIKRKK